MDMGEDRGAWSIYVTWSPGCTDGRLSLFTAPSQDYAGAWSPVTKLEADPGPNNLGSTHHICPSTPTLMAAFKAQVTQDVVGGTVTVEVLTGGR